MSLTLDQSSQQSQESQTSSREKQEEESYFQKLYNQKKRDLQMNSKPLFCEINLGSSEESDLFTNQEEIDCVSDYTLFVSNALDLPLTQVYFYSQTNPIQFSKLLEKARRQVKRQQAKQRSTLKKKLEVTTSTGSSSQEKVKKKRKKTNGMTEIEVKEEETSGNKRMMQMIRNRISAQNSRDKKKQYIKKLEEENENYQYERNTLAKKLEVLSKELELSREQCDNLSKRILEIQYEKRSDMQDQSNQLICFDCGSQNLGRHMEYLEEKSTLLFERILPIRNQIKWTFQQVGVCPFDSSDNNHFNGFLNFNGQHDIQLSQSFLQQQFILLFNLQDQTIQTNQTYYPLEKVCDQSRLLKVDDPDYQLYNSIVERRRQNNICLLEQAEARYIQHQKFMPAEFTETQVDFSAGVVSGLIKKSKQQQTRKEKDTMLAPLSYCDKESKVQTLYCPAAEKLDDQNNIKVTFQDAEWIQLMIPKNNLTTFFQNLGDKSITIKKEDSSSTSQSNEKRGTLMSEILCQVKSVNDFFLSDQDMKK